MTTPQPDPNWKATPEQAEAMFRALQEVVALCETEWGPRFGEKQFRAMVKKAAEKGLPK